MIRKSCLALVFSCLFLLLSTLPSYAIENPLGKPNNKIGIHVFSPTELPDAARLVNSSGGDWGYVTVPIQSSDRDLKKWQNFMILCKKHHIIPLVRLSTINDPNNTASWKKPELTDVIDAANFLHKLDWPTKNRYIIVYNEVNRADEWGGAANPAEYANILSFAVTVFKSKSTDYFIISSGMDNAAPSQGTKYMNQYDFMRQMHQAVPAIFNQVDGLASHSYPNPGFSQAPNATSTMGVGSFIHERALAKEMTGKELPIFITETGWTSSVVSDETKNRYFQETLNTIWNDPGIVAITPFILDARHGGFPQFSFLTSSGSATPQYNFFKNLVKMKGKPTLPVRVLAAEATKESLYPQGEIKQTELRGTFFSRFVASVLKLFNT
jgi:hypothetical protein